METLQYSGVADLESEEDISLEVVASFNTLPTEVICRIFNYLELKERGFAERVCVRWRNILTSRSCPLADVAVINLFEPHIWMDTIAKNRYTTVKGTFVNGFQGLRNLFLHISTAHTAKLWFHTEEFAKNCIDLIAEVLDVKCVDIYPYTEIHILPYLHHRLPNLAALNMRPHSQQFHACGLQLPTFPDFSRLTTLILDNYSVDADFELPKTVTSLDYSKREQTHYRALLPKLVNLTNLEFFTLSHADMSNADDFALFVRSVSNSRLPKLTILTLRMCKICPLDLQGEEFEMDLKMMKFDLCYGNVLTSIKQFLVINKKLGVLALSILCSRNSLETVCEICSELKQKHVGLHLSVLQNYPVGKMFRSAFVDFFPPASFFQVLSKFEASFVEDIVLFEMLLMSGSLQMLRECKFVECDALTSDILRHLSVSPLLRKLDVLSCPRPKDIDVLMFVSNMSTRVTQQLQITWRRNRRIGSLAACYFALLHEQQEMVNEKKVRFSAKTFSEGEEGEEIFVYDDHSSKSVQIRDYNDHQRYRTLGFIIEENEDSTISSAS